MDKTITDKLYGKISDISSDSEWQACFYDLCIRRLKRNADNRMGPDLTNGKAPLLWDQCWGNQEQIIYRKWLPRLVDYVIQLAETRWSQNDSTNCKCTKS